MSNRRCMDRNPLLSILILLLKKMPRLVSLIPIILLFSAIDMTMFRPSFPFLVNSFNDGDMRTFK